MSPDTLTTPDIDVTDEVTLKEPRMYQVLLHNDDYTTMDFVVNVLVEIFHKTREQAATIMMAVHKRGVGIAGVYTYEIAEMKVEAVRERAVKAGFPLRCTLQEVGQ